MIPKELSNPIMTNINQHTDINPNTPISFRDMAQFTKSNTELGVLAFDTFTLDYDIPAFPIRLEAVSIMLCTQGTATMVVDMTEYKIQENSLMVIQPMNFVQFTDHSEDFKSHVVLCDPRVMEQVLPKMTSMLPMLMQHRMMPLQQLTPSEAAGISSFYTFVKLKLEDPYTPFQAQKVMCMLQAALFEIMDIRLAHSEKMPQHHTRREEIMGRFIIEVCRHFQRERQVSFYAKKLCVTPKHLSSVVKEISGRTAGEWIDHYVVMEAKMLLGSTDLTVQEISTQLNFANQSFFGKYFKHHTGIPPTEFRLRYNLSAMDNDPEIL